MDGIITASELITELERMPPDMPVMIAVIKYPEEFQIEVKDGEASWMDHDDVEVQPLEDGEVTMQDGFVCISVELNDYDAQRHFAGG